MSPPTEQLISDYLSRLSAAARGQLGRDDKRALVERTRDFIDQKTGLAGPPTAMEVATLLSRLGDPAGLVEQERQRLAALRGEAKETAVHRGRMAWLLRREAAKTRSSSWHWPAQQGSANLQLTLLDSSSPEPAASPPPANGTSAANGEFRPGTEPSALVTGEAGPAEPVLPAWPSLASSATGQQVDDELNDDESSLLSDQGSTVSVNGSPAWQLHTRTESALARRFRKVGIAIAGWSRRRPLEAAAVLLLGLGGAIYPPVWLLGAVIALVSRLWDYRDKWLGLAAPILLTVVATAVGSTTAGADSSIAQHMHQAWLYADISSRIGAVLGASYLAWRSARGKRPPAIPPWSRPHRVA